jgi:THO complex subunit 3
VKGQVINMVWSADGKYIVTGDKKDNLSVIDTQTWTVVHSMRSSVEINQVRLTKDGKHLITSTTQGKIQILEFPSLGSPVAEVTAHYGSMYALQLSPKQKYLATGGADSQLCIFDTAELVCVEAMGRMTAAVRSISFSHTGEAVAAAADQGNIEICTVPSGEQLCSIPTSQGLGAKCIAFSSRSLELAVAENGNKLIKILKLKATASSKY